MLDQAISYYPRMEAFLQQGMNEQSRHEISVSGLDALLANRGAGQTPGPA